MTAGKRPSRRAAMASSSIKKGRGTVAGRLGDETPQGHPAEYPEKGSLQEKQ